jgi:hypothetical protein
MPVSDRVYTSSALCGEAVEFAVGGGELGLALPQPSLQVLQISGGGGSRNW